MTPRKRYSFFLDDVMGAGLKALKQRGGISEAETALTLGRQTSDAL